MKRFHIPVLFGLLLLADIVVMAQQSFKYNVEYKCGNERIVVRYCRNDNGQQVPPDQNYCQVEFPDRPRRVADIAVFASMLKSEVAVRLQSCVDSTVASGTGQNGTTNNVSAAANQALSRGLALMKSKDYSGAMVEFKEVLRLDPRHAIAFYQVGVAQYNLKEYTVANAAFERALQLNVANPHVVYAWIGDCKRALGQNEKAFSSYREAVRVKPDYAEGFNKMGLAYFALKDYSNAVIFFDQAARLDPKTTIYRKNSGTAYVGGGQKDEAMKVYNALVPVDPKLANELLDEITKPATTAAATKQRTPAEISLNEGLKFYEAKNYEKALASFKEALRLQPDLANGCFQAGRSHYQLKQYPEAIAAFERSLQLKTENPHFIYEWIGDTYYEQKQYAKAIPAFQEAVRLKPDYAQAFTKLGNSKYLLKQYAEAVAAYQAAIKLKPNDAVYHASLGNSYFALKQYDKAGLSYSEAVRIDPKYDYALNMLGVSRYLLKQYAAALAAYESAVKLKPDNAVYQLNLGDTYVELERKTDAITVHNKLAVLDKGKAADLLAHIDVGPEPKTAEEFVTRGEKLFATKNYFGATEDFIKAAQMKPDLLAAQKGLGAAYAARNLPTPSLSAYEKALALNANDPEIYYGLGIAKRGLLKFDEAIAAFQKCITLKPKAVTLADAHFALGELILESRPKDALTEFQSVQRLKPDYPKLQFYIARAQYHGRQYTDALVLFLDGLKKTPDDAELVYYAGMCYVRLGKKPEAVAMYEKLVALGAFSQTNLNGWIKGMK